MLPWIEWRSTNPSRLDKNDKISIKSHMLKPVRSSIKSHSQGRKLQNQNQSTGRHDSDPTEETIKTI